ncbi:MAG: hypothetical protein Sapg2KO_41440 [Saprospiraceae bacterium]
MSCKSQNANIYSSVQKADWHKIDLGSFELEAPKGFKYKQRQGIDSYVGQISNGKITFEFDYGWYSNNKPLTPREVFEDTKTTLYLNDLMSAFQGTMDSASLYFALEENLRVISAIPQGDGTFLANLEMNDQEAQVVFEPFAPGTENEYYQYVIEEEIDRAYYKKIYFPKKLGQRARAGVYMEDLLNKKESPYGYDQLAFYTFDMDQNNKEVLIEIFETIKMKKVKEQD